jgi:hypothetical protein
MPSLACEVEDGRLSGLPFDSTGTLDSDHKGQQSAPYLTRGLPTPPCRCTETADLHGATLVHQRSAIIAIAHRIIWSMLSSQLITDDSPAPSFLHPPLVLTEKTGPSRWRGLSTSARDAGGVAAPIKRGEETGLRIFAVVIWSHRLTTSTAYFCWVWPSRPRTQRKPVPWVCKANPPRPRAVVVMSEIGLCQDPPRIDRTTPFFSGPCGF